MAIASRLILRGTLLGIGAAAPIGPVNVEIARRTFRGGFIAGFALGCGAVTVDVTYAILSSLSLQTVLARPAILRTIEIAGIAFLLYSGVLSVRGAVRAWRADPLAAPDRLASRHGVAYLTGIAMTFLNPMTVGFWFLAIPAALGAITKQPGIDLPMICIGVFIGTIAWVIGFAGALAWAGRWRKNGWLVAADALGGAVLFCFAIAQLWRVLRRPL